jgi:hypothetical protein
MTRTTVTDAKCRPQITHGSNALLLNPHEHPPKWVIRLFNQRSFDWREQGIATMDDTDWHGMST